MMNEQNIGGILYKVSTGKCYHRNCLGHFDREIIKSEWILRDRKKTS